ncbi:LCP family protein [Nocardioides sp. R-C-SC26]|uniref:LCP family protein n=1 Tax=Nocardioides sp. R-C-SC26 TaxID=2870414 RepID=UPI001E38888D|nr:LCP family protein [Nocardioides sp. R-C-SC26]
MTEPSQTSQLSVDTERAAPGDGTPRRRGEAKRGRAVVAGFVAAGLVVTLVLVLGGAYLYRHWNDNIDFRDVDDQLSNRPVKQEVDTGPREPINILVMGSDSREGANNIDGLTGDGERSDTTILFHLSADRSFAYGISIPRDTLVERPDCLTEDGGTIPGSSSAMWNEAFGLGGPACTMQQFEQVTGVRLDNYVVLDFQGFEDMVDAVGGVEVCIPEDISDPSHGINIPAGTREVAGREALNYVRARYTLGDGSDIGRIKRQQAFVAAMASKVVSAGTLSRVDKVISFVNAATSSLQTDFRSVGQMAQVGAQFEGVGLDRIRFVTVPWQYSPIDPNRVEMLPEADALWQRVIEDRPLPKSLRSSVVKASDDVQGRPQGSGGARAEERAAERRSAGLCA